MDLSVFQLIHSLSGHSAVLDWFLVFIASYIPYFLVFSFILFSLKFSGWRRKLWVGLVGALSVILARGVLTEVIRFFAERPRPFLVLEFQPLIETTSFSFPSGHAAFFFALAAAIWYFNRNWGYWFAGFSFLVSLARISVGIHWPSDILGGILVGFVSFAAVYFLFQKTVPGGFEITKEQ